MSTVKEMREKSATIALQAQAKLKEITDKTGESRAKEIETEVDAMMADYDAIEARISRMAKLEAIEASVNEADPRRPTEDRSVQGVNNAFDHGKAFEHYVRSGATVWNGHRLEADRTEQRAQTVGTLTAGGYLAPTILADQMFIGMKYYGPMVNTDAVNTIQTETGAAWQFPTMDDTANRGRRLTTEGTTLATTALTFGLKSLGAFTYTTDVVPVSNELLQDSSFDVQTLVVNAMSERMGRILNTELTTGTGAGTMPNGFLNAATLSATTIANSAISFDDVITLNHSVDIAYRSGPKNAFQFNDTTLQALRKVKDAYGRYIWEPAVTLGAEPNILGYRYWVNNDMPTIGAGVAGVMAFGDWSKYTVRLVKAYSVVRLNERYADQGLVGFIGYARADGNLMDTKAIALLNVHA